MHAEIIAIGDEITSGRLLDTNTQWLSQRLEEMGIRVLYHSTVGDELEPCAEVFRRALDRADVVIATGGLGPTADDLTRESIARAASRRLVLDPAALEHIRDLFARRKREMPKRNERQALFPEGARPIHNPHGTAPGIDLEVSRPDTVPSRLFALPGVPSEMRDMWHDSVADALVKMGGSGQLIRRRQIKCFGAGESQIEEMLPDMIRRGRKPTVGITASKTTIILRIAAEGASEEDCYAAMEPTIATIRECLGTLVFGEDDDELQDVVVGLLRQQNKTLATAEWGTAGTVASWLDSVPEADDCYLGGLVTPVDMTLQNMLGIEADLLEQPATEGGQLAAAMAAGCRRRFHSDYGLAVGRFPEFDASAREPGRVFIALADADGVRVQGFPFAGDPALLKNYAAKRALNLARLAMLGE